MNIVISLVGGLGLFLYGMKMMSDGLQKVTGAKMRSILEVFTRNRVIGVLVGTFFTALIQSSNATTVMVVSFVNSGLMKVSQSAGIILGANIGTTVTGQIIAFDLADIAPLFIIIGVIMAVFVKRHLTINRLGEIILGFGLLFLGISTMSGALDQAKEIPQFVSVLAALKNPFLAFAVGFVATAILQSNSVMVGIIMLLAREGMMQLPVCLYMMLGCNIGCTMSAVLASIGCRKDAKRAASLHLMFNIFGTCICALTLIFAGDYVVGFFMRISGNEAGRMIANANSIIKVCEVLILLPLAPIFVKLSYLLISGHDEEEEEFELVYIGNQYVFSPTTAVLQAIREMERMADMALTNLVRAMNTLIDHNQKELEEVRQTERNIDYLNKEITNYLVHINQSELPIDDAMSIGALFHVVNDIERIGDYAQNTADASARMRDSEISFSKNGIRDLSEMLDMVLKILTYSNEMFSYNDRRHMVDILSLENEIDEKERELQERHIERLTQNECTPEAGMIFSDLLSELERVADHATNIAFSILEEDPDEREKMKA
ncbi:MAG: Na/Pi cotransporter family protein [Clostridia bacterium]|nr:Na/Pi cotransporter family protein [Clostridia bacterium]NCC43495.1 Na/Pi cotransporter family protein [Clostridia bacterium]